MKSLFQFPTASKYTFFVYWAIAGFLSSSAVAADLSGEAVESVLSSAGQQLAQLPDLSDEQPNPRLDERPPSRQPLPELDPGLPPLDDLLELPETPDTPTPLPELKGDRICVERFEVTGSTVYDAEMLAQIAATAVLPDLPDCRISGKEGSRLTFAELQQARDAITRHYVADGYVTSGAFIPEQTLATGIVQLQTLEGRVEEIEVLGLEKLNSAYVRDRIALASQTPLNTEDLLQGLQLLQLDPLLETIDVELATGVLPGTNRLVAKVTEANPYRLGLVLDNGRTPLVGSFQRRSRGGHLNLLGQGDRFLADYVNTDGSNSVELSYTYPLNARNGTLNFSHGRTSSWVIEDDFEILDIRSRSQYYELTYRQPLYQTPTREFALSLTGSHQRSESRFNPGGFGDRPFPTRGSDNEGQTRITALRFSQEWLNRDSRQVLALRSQFSLGVDALDATQSLTSPDSNFFSW
ncbi:MAG: POTRA domain-containing protein, partial [Cyanobacteria bacterium P01_D01_bin.123]